MTFKMKISAELFDELKAVVRVPYEATERQRWDALWASGYPVSKLYDAGLNDDHIDTALKAIAKRQAHDAAERELNAMRDAKPAYCPELDGPDHNRAWYDTSAE